MYDYGARFYDPSLSTFLGVDRLTEKYVGLTPYHYGAQNPVTFLDVNGDSIRVNDVTYMPMQGYNGDDSFVSQTFEALDYMHESGADKKGLICELACSKDKDVTIVEIGGKYNQIAGAHAAGGENAHNTAGTIGWDPSLGVKFWEPNGMPMDLFTSEIGYRSPAEVLFHEIGHAHSQAFSFKMFWRNLEKFSQYSPDYKWTNQEEFNNINYNENPAAQVLRPGSLNRSSHRERWSIYKAASVTSIKKK